MYRGNIMKRLKILTVAAYVVAFVGLGLFTLGDYLLKNAGLAVAGSLVLIISGIAALVLTYLLVKKKSEIKTEDAAAFSEEHHAA